MRKFILAIVATVFSLTLSTGALAGNILFDPLGTSGANGGPINTLEFARGNGLAVNGVTAVQNFLANQNDGGSRDTTTEFFYQATLATATVDGNNNVLPASSVFTVVAAITETVVSTESSATLESLILTW